LFAGKVWGSTGEIGGGSDTVLADPSVPLKDILVPS
jgi:3-phenylpropionate/trans-cinnamate dioxygenase ferredoxin reductase subunit